MTKVFLTGASGYIGGDVLYLLANNHPDFLVSALVRDADKGKKIKEVYKNIQIVAGDLDDTDLIKQEATEADVILHLAATGHLKSVQAIHTALRDSNRSKPGHWIQISGASVLAADELADPKYVPGSESSVVFDDLDGIEDIRAMIRRHPTSRAVDNYILDMAARTPTVRTALVAPPIIYGKGRGPVHQRSVQIPELARVTIERKRGLRVGAGLSQWGDVHIGDVGGLLLRLAEEAVQEQGAPGSDIPSSPQLWGENGIYLTGLGEQTFGEISQAVAEAAAKQGLIPSADVDEVNGTDADTLLPHGNLLYGTNARSKSRRGKEVAGWKPHHGNLAEEIPRAVEAEARDLAAKGQ